jgi:hypothetical protein
LIQNDLLQNDGTDVEFCLLEINCFDVQTHPNAGYPPIRR